ncbi:MAG: hypothetical protein AAFZ92_06100, partial [Pseudomonadota bacterium]
MFIKTEPIIVPDQLLLPRQLVVRGHGTPLSSATPATMANALSFASWVSHCKGEEFWLSLLNHYQLLSAGLLNETPYVAAAHLIDCGVIRVYQLPHVGHYRCAHDEQGKGYYFFKGPDRLPYLSANKYDYVPTTDAESVDTLLNSLKHERHTWIDYLFTVGYRSAVIPLDTPEKQKA